MPDQATRRQVLAGAITGAAALALGGPATAAARPARPLRILVATNEPWGTYHTRPIVAAAQRDGVQLTQIVPDYSRIAPGDPVAVTTLADVGQADLLVVSGATDWPLECAGRLDHLPLLASSFAYMLPEPAPRAAELSGLRFITSSAPAEARAFTAHLATRRRAYVVGSAQTDDLPPRTPEPGRVLVLTSVTRPDPTGSAAPGTELLAAAAERLAAAGKKIVVGLHPRENPALWSGYETATGTSIQAAARAEAAIGIPGTVFPFIAAVGTPVVGVTDPRLRVPDYLRSVCSETVADADQAVTAVERARLPDAATLADAVGPIGGSARRLLRIWRPVALAGRRRR